MSMGLAYLSCTLAPLSFTTLHSCTDQFFLGLSVLLQLLRNTPVGTPPARRILARGNRIVNI